MKHVMHNSNIMVRQRQEIKFFVWNSIFHWPWLLTWYPRKRMKLLSCLINSQTNIWTKSQIFPGKCFLWFNISFFSLSGFFSSKLLRMHPNVAITCPFSANHFLSKVNYSVSEEALSSVTIRWHLEYLSIDILWNLQEINSV